MPCKATEDWVFTKRQAHAARLGGTLQPQKGNSMTVVAIYLVNLPKLAPTSVKVDGAPCAILRQRQRQASAQRSRLLVYERCPIHLFVLAPVCVK